MKPLEIDHIQVSVGRMVLEARARLDCLHVSQQLAAELCKRYPNLPSHVCVNQKGATFGDELVGTELPHLLEHLAIELAVQAGEEGDGLMGHTSWLDELADTRAQGYACMQVALTFHDDLACLAAVKEAQRIINALCSQTLA